MTDTTSNTPPLDQYQFAVCCPGEGAMLSMLRRFIATVAQDMGFPEDDVIKIEMAVDEACSNAVLHAYGDSDAAPQTHGIELKLHVEPEVLTIQIQDQSKGLAEELPAWGSISDYHDLARDRFHGLGLLIMREFMDEVRFTVAPQAGTRVIMRKVLRPTRQGPPGRQDLPPGHSAARNTRGLTS